VTSVVGHALVQREDIPLPPVVFAWAAAAVLVISFVGLAALWPQPRLEDARRRPWLRLPGAVDAICGAIGVFVLGVIVWAGFAGEQSATTNLAPTLVYAVVWVGFVLASILLGDVFRAFNPWRALGRLLRLRGVRPYPERLGHWPAALGLLFFTWTELVGLYGNEPDTLAVCAILYTLLNLGGMALYGTEKWISRAEAFGVYFGLFARIAPRPLLGGLPRFEPRAGSVALVAVMIGTVTYDGFTRSAAWATGIGQALNDVFDGPFGASTATYVAGSIGLVGCTLVVAAFYAVGVAGAESVGGGMTAERLRGAFLHTLIPIAAAYVLAHYFSFLVSEVQHAWAVASDPLGRGWDLFGTAGTGISYLNGKINWYVQVGVVIAGHVAGLVLAHDRALALYSDARAAVRSQYWMLSVMVGFTSLALWLLSQSNS
jgi:hypothetical protein